MLKKVEVEAYRRVTCHPGPWFSSKISFCVNLNKISGFLFKIQIIIFIYYSLEILYGEPNATFPITGLSLIQIVQNSCQILTMLPCTALYSHTLIFNFKRASCPSFFHCDMWMLASLLNLIMFVNKNVKNLLGNII